MAEPMPLDTFPVEVEIILTPDGRVIFADLPADLEPLALAIGTPVPTDAIDAESALPGEGKETGHE